MDPPGESRTDLMNDKKRVIRIRPLDRILAEGHKATASFKLQEDSSGEGV